MPKTPSWLDITAEKYRRLRAEALDRADNVTAKIYEQILDDLVERQLSLELLQYQLEQEKKLEVYKLLSPIEIVAVGDGWVTTSRFRQYLEHTSKEMARAIYESMIKENIMPDDLKDIILTVTIRN